MVDASPVTRNSQITASNTAEASGVNRLLKASWAAAQRRALSVVRRYPAKSPAQRAKTDGSALATRSWARPVNTERDAVGRRRRRGNGRGAEIPRFACSVSAAQSPLWMEVTLGEYRTFASATGGGAGRGCSNVFTDRDDDGHCWRNCRMLHGSARGVSIITRGTPGGTAACFTAAPGASASSPAAPTVPPTSAGPPPDSALRGRWSSRMPKLTEEPLSDPNGGSMDPIGWPWRAWSCRGPERTVPRRIGRG